MGQVLQERPELEVEARREAKRAGDGWQVFEAGEFVHHDQHWVTTWLCRHPVDCCRDQQAQKARIATIACESSSDLPRVRMLDRGGMEGVRLGSNVLRHFIGFSGFWNRLKSGSWFGALLESRPKGAFTRFPSSAVNFACARISRSFPGELPSRRVRRQPWHCRTALFSASSAT